MEMEMEMNETGRDRRRNKVWEKPEDEQSIQCNNNGFLNTEPRREAAEVCGCVCLSNMKS